MIDISYRCEEEIDAGIEFENLAEICLRLTNYQASPLPEISLSLVSAKEIQELNQQFRNKNKVTDVLSFPDDSPAPVLGDIVICVARAQEQAEELGHGLKREIAFLFVHGLLHLLGYDHEISAEAEAEMFSLQDQVLAEAAIDRL